MPHLHWDMVNADTVTTTLGSVELIGNITTSADTTDVLGFWVQSAGTGTSTTAEGVQVIYQINARSLLPEVINLQDTWSNGGKVATNHGGSLNYGKFLPIMPNNVALGNRLITGNADQAMEATADHAAQFGVFFAEGAYPTDVMRNRNKVMTRTRWTGTSSDVDIGNAVSEAFPAGLIIPGWLKEVVAIEVSATTDAIPTAAEHFLGFLEISGTVPGLFPMRYALPAYGGGLGTDPHGQHLVESITMPAYIKLPGVDSTLNFTAVINAVTSGVFNVSVTVYCR